MLRGSPEKPWQDFRRAGIFGTSANFDRLTAINGRRSGRRHSVGDRAAVLGRLTFSILVPFPAVAALPAAYKRAADAWPTLPTSHNCRALRQVAGPFRQVPSRKSCRLAMRPIIRPSFAVAAGRAAGLVERRGGWRPGQSGLAARSGGLAAVLAFPVGKIGGAAAFFGGQKGGYGPAAGSGIRSGKSAGGRPAPAAHAARLGSWQARRC